MLLGHGEHQRCIQSFTAVTDRFERLHRDGDCCRRWPHLLIESLVNTARAGCAARCRRSARCTHFSVSRSEHDCHLCSGCRLSTGLSSERYWSWERHISSMAWADSPLEHAASVSFLDTAGLTTSVRHAGLAVSFVAPTRKASTPGAPTVLSTDARYFSLLDTDAMTVCDRARSPGRAGGILLAARQAGLRTKLYWALLRHESNGLVHLSRLTEIRDLVEGAYDVSHNFDATAVKPPRGSRCACSFLAIGGQATGRATGQSSHSTCAWTRTAVFCAAN
jgi:hypothetical protein